MKILAKVMKEMDFFYLDTCCAAFTPIWKTVSLFKQIYVIKHLDIDIRDKTATENISIPPVEMGISVENKFYVLKFSYTHFFTKTSIKVESGFGTCQKTTVFCNSTSSVEW